MVNSHDFFVGIYLSAPRSSAYQRASRLISLAGLPSFAEDMSNEKKLWLLGLYRELYLESIMRCDLSLQGIYIYMQSYMLG